MLFRSDYLVAAATHEPVSEPVVVRPKFPEQLAPAEVAKVAADPVESARLAINRTNDLSVLDALRDRVNQRHREGTFTEAQRNELVHLIDGKCEWLESEPKDGEQEFTHESPATEAVS